MGRRRHLIIGSVLALAVPVMAVTAPAVHAAVSLPEIVSVDPARVLETRLGPDLETVDGLFEGIGAIPAGGEVALQIGGRAGVPDDAHAVVFNIVAIAPDGPGHLTAYPCGGDVPTASNVNYDAGEVVANTAVVELGDDGTVCIASFATANVVVDVNAWVPAGASLDATGPARIAETRSGPADTTIDGVSQGIGRLAAGSITKVQVAGRAEVPTDAAAAMVNVAAILPGAAGFLQVYGCDPVRPFTSSVNYTPGDVVANLVFTDLDDDGALCVYTLADVDLVMDLAAFVPADGDLPTVPGARLLDTRSGPDDETVDGLFEGSGPIPAGGFAELVVAGRAGVAADAQAVFLNLAAIDPDADGFLQAFPCGVERPDTSNVNYVAGQVVANSVIAKVGDGGAVCIYSSATSDAIVDVSGYVPASDDPPPTPDVGSVTIALDATPDDAADVTFTSDLPGGASFDLDDDADAALASSAVFDTVAVGVYAVSAAVPAGWQLDAATCSDGSPVDAIDVSVDESITCTFEISPVPAMADLSITKADDVDPVVAGDTIEYTVEVANAGPDAAADVVVTDTLPAGLTLVATTGCAEDPAAVPSCSLGTIAAGASASYTVEVTVDAGTVGTLTNEASVTSSTADPNLTDNSVAEETVALPTAGLSITKTDDVDPVVAGSTLTYTIEVTNGGPQAADDVVVTDTLPAGVTLVASSGCAEDPAAVPTCSLGTIAAGASASYTVEVTVDAGTLGTIINSATVASSTVDPNPGDDSTTEETTVVAPSADLSITKTDSADPVTGSSLTYTIEVANAGPSEATDVVVTDTLPAGVTFVSTTGCAEDPSGVPTCSLGTIVAGGSASYMVAVSVDAATSGTITNSASVTSSTADPNGANNSTTEDTEVADALNVVADAFNAAGNVGIDVPAGSGLLDNDMGDSSLAVTSFDAASANGGSVSVAADGGFTYTPATGYTGPDTFDYTAADASGSDTATVTITVSDMYWFIDNSLTDAGDGSLATPFNTLAAFEAVNGNAGATNPGTGDVIFVATGSGNYVGGITLEQSQTLIGAGSTVAVNVAAGTTLPPFSNSLPATGGTRPVIADGGGIDDAVALAIHNTIRGVAVSNTGGGAGITGNTVGASTVLETAVVSNGGPALDIATGVLSMTLDGVSVPASATGGIDLTGIGTGSSVNLSGVAITTTGGTGVNVSGSGAGSFVVTGPGNTVSSTNGAAVVLNGLSIGGAGVTFQSVSASNTTTGITLTDIGPGPFTVTGLGTVDGSGGSLSDLTDDGVVLFVTTAPITLNNMTFERIGSMAGPTNTRSGHDAIYGQSATGGLSIDNATVNQLSDTFVHASSAADVDEPTAFVGLSVTNSTITDTNRFHIPGLGDDVDEGAIRLVGVSGTVTVTGNTFTRGGTFVDITSAAAGTLNLDVQNNSFTDAYQEYTAGPVAAVGRYCVAVQPVGSTTVTATISNNTFENCRLASIRLISHPTTSGPTTATVSGNTLRVTDHSSTQGLSANFPQGGMLLRHLGSGAFDALVSGNSFGDWTGSATTNWVMNADGAVGALSILAEGGNTQVEATGNTFNSPINSPFFIRADGTGSDAEVHFHSNTYRSQFAFVSPDPFFGTFLMPGIPHEAIGQNSATLDVTFENEAISAHDETFISGDTLDVRASSSATTCASFTNVTTALAGPPNGDIRVVNSSATLNLHDGGGNDPFDQSGTIGPVGSCVQPTGPIFP